MGETYKALESFYGGGASNFTPDSSNSFVNSNADVFVGYQLNPSQIGFSTNPTTADQLGELQRGIRSGARVVEVNLLRIGIQGGGDSDQVVPKQHFDEMKALSKLTGVSPSIHGPLLDAAGFNEQQGVWSEENRENTERIMLEAMEKAKWADPDKDIPVIFHSSNMLGGGTQYKPGKKDEETGLRTFEEEIVPIYDRKEKRLAQIQEGTQYSLGGKGKEFKKKMTVDDRIRSQNETTWDNEIKKLTLEKSQGDKLLNEAIATREGTLLAQGKDPYKDMEPQEAQPRAAELNRRVHTAHNILENNRVSFRSLFDQAYDYGSKKQRKELKKMSDDWAKEKAEIDKETRGNQLLRFAKDSALQDKYMQRLQGITTIQYETDKNGRLKLDKKGKPIEIKGYGAPEIVTRGENFAMKEAAKTFGRVGAKTYLRHGKDNAPRVAIENVWNGAMFSRGKDMKKLVEKSREEMTNYLVKQGMQEKIAKKAAKAKIGMNFDVGHMNMFRKRGFTTEEMAAEVKEFAPHVMHMHLTDNFGFSDEHLYPGQGNVPFKEFFTELKKSQPHIDKNVKMIVETGGVEARHMGGRSAHAFNLAAFGVPIFGSDYWAGPTFNAALNTFGNYSSGYGETSPGIHHNLYGAGFSGLPPEVGGIVPGLPGSGSGQSRFGGTPMA